MTLLNRNTNLSTVASRGLMFTLIWWVLTDGAVDSWWFGVPAIIAALIISIKLVAPTHLIWYALVKFMPVFIARSWLGGVDVARRAFDPKLPIAPVLIHYTLQLPPGLSQVAVANTVSLLPGTLSTKLEGNCLSVHVLDGQSKYLEEIKLLERHVGRIFNVT